MNQRNSQDISHVSVYVNLMVENVTRDKNGAMIGANMSVKNQQHILHVKRTIFGILAHVLASVTSVIRDSLCIKSLADDLLVTCDEIGDR